MIDPKKTMDQFDALDARYTRLCASHVDLLAAAKEALATSHDESFPVYVFDQLRAAIAKAEES